MNQAERKSNLTREQKHTLEGVYTCLTGITTYLTAHAPYVIPEDQAAIENLINFGTLCISRLVACFDEVAAWEQRGRR